eukprot:SAG25_NODE_3066_length_1236_cov_1.083553_3_plen_61_part_00
MATPGQVLHSSDGNQRGLRTITDTIERHGIGLGETIAVETVDGATQEVRGVSVESVESVS